MKGNGFEIGKVECNKAAIMRPSEIFDSVQALADNKSCGEDCITAEHLSLQARSLYPCSVWVLSMARHLTAC